MSPPAEASVGKVTTAITVTNRIDQSLADRGFIPSEAVCSVTLQDVLVDTGATHLCLPADSISQLGLVMQAEVDIKIATGIHTA